MNTTTKISVILLGIGFIGLAIINFTKPKVDYQLNVKSDKVTLYDEEGNELSHGKFEDIQELIINDNQ